MVWFQCEDCGDNLKKPKLPNHFRQCSASKLSCIDCGKVFGQHDVEGHTQCITEAMTTHSSSGSTSMTSSSNFDGRKPLWRYVTVSSTSGGGSGGVEWQCNFCHVKKKTTYTRVVNHLLKRGGEIKACSNVGEKDMTEMLKLIEEEEKEQASGAPKFVPLPPSTMLLSEAYKGYSDSKKRKGSDGGPTTLGTTFNIQGHNTLNALIARFFYASGLPFHLSKSPYYAACFSYAASNNLAGYVPPSYNTLRTSLLQQEKANVERSLQSIKDTWHEKGVSIVSNGWSDSQRRPLINFMAVTESGPMFLKAVDNSRMTKDKYFIFNLMKEVIHKVGPQNVVQIITDNARNCSAAGALVEGLYPHIIWMPCVVHTLTLALENICAAKNVENNQETFELCSWISDIAADAIMIKNYIMNHDLRLAMFNSFSPLKLLSIAPTRYASVIVMLKRIKLLKRSLSEMVISDQWECYREDDVEKATVVKLKVLDDMWWEKVDYILSFTAPLYDMIRACDTVKPRLHLVYDMWDTMIKKVKTAIYKHERIKPHESSDFFNVVHAILVSRWNKNNTPLHCLAHSLNPRYYSDQWLNEDTSRIPPHKNYEIAKEIMKCLKKYFPDVAQRRIVSMEYANFASMSEDFADFDSMELRYVLDPKDWWVVYGTSAPGLQGLALKLLGQPSSSSCAERNWSTYSFIHSLRRNKISTQRAEDLVFIHSNLRLLSRKTPEYSKGSSKLWDIGGDKFGTFEDVGDLEFAELSLDEPELERVVFDEDGNGDDLEEGMDGDDSIQEKYGPKGQGRAASGMNAKPKNDAKPKPEVDVNVGLSERPPWFCSLCNTKATSKQALLLHADGKKHRAKSRGFHAKQQASCTVQTNGSAENNATNQVTENKDIGDSKDLNSSKVDPLHDGSGTENNSLESNKKRKLEASENGVAHHKSIVDVSAELSNGKVIEINGAETEVTKGSKKAKLSAKEEHTNLDSTEKNIKWKKLIISALKYNPEGALKIKKLKKIVVKSLKETGCNVDKNQVCEAIEQKIESSSRFSVDGKYVRLSTTS